MSVNLVTIKSLSLVFTLVFSSTIFASNQSINSFGAQEISNLTITKLNHSGSLEMTNSTIEAFAIINGKLEAKNTVFSELTVNGDAELDSSQVQGNVAINGNLEADGSAFNGPVLIHGHIGAESSQFLNIITLHGNQAEFEECSLNKIIVQRSQNKTPQIIYLEDTAVTGDIIFEQGNGIVMIDGNSTVLGKVQGGEIKKS